jgi:hypothetical protein
MEKNVIDYEALDAKLNAKKVYKLADVQHRIKKVAFDVVRFMDGEDIDGLWKIEKTPDGEFILANYEEDLTKEASAKSSWSTHVNKRTDDVHIFYKNYPISKIASAEFVNMGIPEAEINEVIASLPKKLANNSKLVRGLLNKLSENERQELFSKHPELAK